MASPITFKFVDLDYQLDAINSVVQLFNGQDKTEGDSIYRSASLGEIAERVLGRNPRFQVPKRRILENLNIVQTENKHLIPDDILFEGYNFTIEMETGTGKTYVYLRTILELHKQYGYRKFIIVVPSIAIRQGVEKSIEQLNDTFKALYDGLEIKSRAFVYNSGNLGELQSRFIENTDLSIVVMNMQAFNKDTTLIKKEREGRTKLWDLMRDVKPIVIIDEPQKLEGGKKKSASLASIEELDPLFILRYSATHKNTYNMVYKLTSYDAYNQNLVKKICVKTVYGEVPTDFPYIRYVRFTTDLKAKIEIFARDEKRGIIKKRFDVLDGYKLSELSGGLEQYKGMYVEGNPHKIEGLTIAKTRSQGQLTLFNETARDSAWGITIKNGSDTLTLLPGDCTYNEVLRETNSAVIRVQIQAAIRSHLDRQFSILESGKEIKAVALFFIDSVKKYRSGNADEPGLYLKIFEEEYQKLIEKPKYKDYFKKYAKYFPDYKDVQKVHEGYFAIDKKQKVVDPEEISQNNNSDTSVEDLYKAKSKEDIARGIDLILRDKEKLISFDTPLAFIFSHSALREGWDNPNVFTICTLKESSNEMAKKQEIGRGLRLPVDTSGNRCHDEDINWLTVVANAYYEDFAANLQADFDEANKFDHDIATPYEFIETLRTAKLPREKITKELAKILRDELKSKAVINSKGKLNKNVDISKISFRDATLSQYEQAIQDAFIEVMTEKGSRIHIKNGDEPEDTNEKHSYMHEAAFMQMMNELQVRLEKRTFYQVEINSAEFIETAGRNLQQLLETKSLIEQTITVTTSEVEMKENGKTTLSEEVTGYYTDKMPLVWHKKTDFEIINYIMKQTRLPRLAIYSILNEIDPELREHLRVQDVLDKAVKGLQDLLTERKSKHVSGYQVIDNYLFDSGELFIPDKIDSDTLRELELNEGFTNTAYKTRPQNRKAVYKYYRTDSKGEKDFARELDGDEHVLLFTKLHKGGFVIDTPEGDYSPDWAVIYKHDDDTTKLYFIVETKIDKEDKDLTAVEDTKIRCGKLHFEAVSTSLGKQVEYFKAKSYREFKQRVEAKREI
ncbi:DEAD/DEAH box helicase family protein [Methanoculleus sp.]|uniref:restriction endonuclease n=1 Tax=Methanoculleus sp. TaxID=90427 RepID=UPI0025EF161C|nr:DEAD/DEAH box helicase family protein [Methanoculleus sp.]